MRILTLWSTTPLSQVTRPSSSTTATSQRPLKFSSRSPPATPGPRTYMTRRSVTTPSAERSLHHCSLWSEKNQGRRQALYSPEESLLSSQSLSVGHARTGRLVDKFGSLISNFRKNPCRDSENEQKTKKDSSGSTKNRFSLIVEQRFRNTSSRPIMTEKYPKK